MRDTEPLGVMARFCHSGPGFEPWSQPQVVPQPGESSVRGNGRPSESLSERESLRVVERHSLSRLSDEREFATATPPKPSVAALTGEDGRWLLLRTPDDGTRTD